MKSPAHSNRYNPAADPQALERPDSSVLAGPRPTRDRPRTRPSWNAASVGGVGSLFFDGANTRAMNGGQRANIYSPTTYSGGSSISHLDEDFYVLNTFLMNPATTIGPSIRGYSNLEIGILRDLGYTHAQAVPEPASMVALVLGALAMFRRRKRA